MRANNMTSTVLQSGKNYFVPESRQAYGDQSAMGQWALDTDNERMARFEVARQDGYNRGEMYRLGRYGLTSTVSSVGATNYRGVAVAPATAGSVDPFSLVSQDYYFPTGFVSKSYQRQVELFSSADRPWYVRSMAFVKATLMSPLSLIEEGGRGILNVPYAGSQVGQHAAIFTQASDVETKVRAGLNIVKFGSEGFVSAYAGGSLGKNVYVQAQDEAVSFWLKRELDGDVRKFNDVYTSAVDGTRRLGYTFEGVSGYRAHNNWTQATQRGEYMSLQRPTNPAEAIDRNALSPLWGNNAAELYQVTTGRGFYFKGEVAPQSGWFEGARFSLEGGNTQIFMPVTRLPDGTLKSPWVDSVKVPYGQ